MLLVAWYGKLRETYRTSLKLMAVNMIVNAHLNLVTTVVVTINGILEVRGFQIFHLSSPECKAVFLLDYTFRGPLALPS